MTNATWSKKPTSADYNTGDNWSGGTVPDGKATFGATNTASLTFSAAFTTIGSWALNAQAGKYSFLLGAGKELDFTGAGIAIAHGGATITDDGAMQFENSSTAGTAHFQVDDFIYFGNSAKAGSASILVDAPGVARFADTASAAKSHITLEGSARVEFDGTSKAGSATIQTGSSGQALFEDSSNAGKAHIVDDATVTFENSSSAGSAKLNVGGALFFDTNSTAASATLINGTAGLVYFEDESTAGQASITNSNQLRFVNFATAGNASIVNDGVLQFFDSSTGGNAKIVNNGEIDVAYSASLGAAKITNNGTITFADASVVESAVITSNKGASVIFSGTSDGEVVRLITKAGGQVDFSETAGRNANHEISVGSIEGAGTYFLGQNQVSVGNYALSTKVTGLIADGGADGGTGASLLKNGIDTLTLSHANNTYTGGTSIEEGTLNIAALGAAGSGDIKFVAEGLQTGTLKIQNAALSQHALSNTIEDFGASDKIDLAGLKFTNKAHFSIDDLGGLEVLSVVSGKVTDKLTLLDAESSAFLLKNDGHGGTMVLLQAKEKPAAHVAGSNPPEEVGLDADMHHGAHAHHDFLF